MSLNNFRTLNECNTENACNVNPLNEVISVFTLQNKSSPCHLCAVANWMLRLAVDSCSHERCVHVDKRINLHLKWRVVLT